MALFLPSLNGGGAERVAIFVGRFLEARGYTVDLVAANGVGALADDPWVRTHLVNLGWRLELLAVPPWIAYLRRVRPDVAVSLVHSANFISGIGAKLVPEVPVVVAIHNTLVKEPAHQWWVRRYFGFSPERHLYRRAALVQAVSEALADQAHELFAVPRDRLFTIYNPAEPTTESAAAISAADRAEIAEAGDYVISVGRLIPIKGFDRLIKAFARAAIPISVRLIILGEGPERQRLRALADGLGLGDRLRIVGFRDPVTPWLRAAKGFVLATSGEGFPLVVLEALGAGLPVAGTRAPGVTEALGEGRIGRLIDRDDPDGFVRAIEDIASGNLRPPEPDVLALHLVQYAPETVGQRYVDMIERVLRERSGRR